jgi:tripartite-type tricarboxylate transporter receptor subunit TctC
MLRALIGGEVDIAPAAAIFPKLHAGRVRALMVLETARWPDLPDVQTLAEAGLNVPPISYWGGFVVRAGTSGEIVERLARELATATREPEALKQIQASGHTTRFSASPEDFRRVIRDDLSWMSEAAKLIPSPAK